MQEEKGLIHIYCGDGKGKTTASIGLAVRFSGYQKKSLIVQFFKTGDSGEYNSLSRIPLVEIMPAQRDCKFFFMMNDREKYENKQHNLKAINYVKQRMNNDIKLVVLDEIFSLIQCGQIDKEIVLDLIKNKPYDVEIVLTGREPGDEFLSVADYVSEVKKIKHPYDYGVNARQGIEF